MVQWTQNVSTPLWFQGVVQRYEAGRGHYVLYPEDGDMQWHNLDRYRYHVIKAPDPKSKCDDSEPEEDKKE